jgi:hypothetical protein
MEKCAEVWLGKEHQMYLLLFQLLDFAPLILAVILGIITYKLAKRYIIHGKTITAKITSVEDNIVVDEVDGTKINKGVIVHYQYECNGQVFENKRSILYVPQPLSAGQDFQITVSTADPSVEIPPSKVSMASTLAMMTAVVVGCGVINVLEEVGRTLCR